MTAAQARMADPTPDPRCGTHAGYVAHWRRGENACDPCRDGHNAGNRASSNKRRVSLTPTDHEECGTSTGAALHARRGERLCEECRQARLEKRRDKSSVGRPPRPTKEAMDGAACHGLMHAPRVMLHDCRQPHEADAEWNARRAAARAVCRRCPVFAACDQLRAHYDGLRQGIDGILAGHPTSTPATNRKDLP